MKRILTLGFGLLVLANSAVAKVEVFACEPEWKALAEALGGEQVQVYSATTAFQDPHYIEARPSLIAKTRRADLLFCTGADLEVGWLPLLLRQSGNARIQESAPGYFMATEQVALIEVPKELDRSQGDVHAAGNPHVHWSPHRLLTIAEAFASRLQSIDPDHADYYRQQYQTFSGQWQASIERWESSAQTLRGRKVVVHHKHWSYLLDWLGIEAVADLEPKPGLPPTSSHLAQVLKVVEAQQPELVLVANYQDERGANWLQQKSGIGVLRLPYTVGGSDAAMDLTSLYDSVLSALEKVQ